MPITAKFSKQFYDRLGHDVVDELVNHLNEVDATYRSELRDLNDANFVRFQAELRAVVAESETRLIRWMFAFWVPTALGVVGTAIAVISLLLR